MSITVKILNLDIKKDYIIYITLFIQEICPSLKKTKPKHLNIIVFKQNNCPLQPLLLLLFKCILHGGEVLFPLKKLILLGL